MEWSSFLFVQAQQLRKLKLVTSQTRPIHQSFFIVPHTVPLFAGKIIQLRQKERVKWQGEKQLESCDFFPKKKKGGWPHDYLLSTVLTS